MSHWTWKMDRPQTGEIVMPPRRNGSHCPLALLTTDAKQNCERKLYKLCNAFEWYTMVYPTHQLYFSESAHPRANLFFLGIHPRLKARVWTDKIQVTSGISKVYHSNTVTNMTNEWQSLRRLGVVDSHRTWFIVLNPRRIQESGFVVRATDPLSR